MRDLLAARLKPLAENAGWPVALPNRHFNPEDTDKYLRASILPADPEVIGLCEGVSRYVWLFQISIIVRDGVGEPASMIDAMRSLFSFGEELTTENHSFQVMKPPAAISPVPLDGWYSTPVQHRLQSFR